MKKTLLVILLVVVTSACAARSGSNKYLNHTVRYQGETLGTISSWYTGTSQNWTAIQKENPGLVVNKIRPGDTIKIPERLVRRSEPLPQSFVAGQKITTAKAGNAATQTQEASNDTYDSTESASSDVAAEGWSDSTAEEVAVVVEEDYPAPAADTAGAEAAANAAAEAQASAAAAETDAAIAEADAAVAEAQASAYAAAQAAQAGNQEAAMEAAQDAQNAAARAAQEAMKQAEAATAAANAQLNQAMQDAQKAQGQTIQ